MGAARGLPGRSDLAQRCARCRQPVPGAIPSQGTGEPGQGCAEPGQAGTDAAGAGNHREPHPFGQRIDHCGPP